MLSKHAAAEAISGLKLIEGGSTLDQYNNANVACIMQAVNIYRSALVGEEILTNGEAVQYTGLPNVCPTIEQYMIEFNDAIESDKDRQSLLNYVPNLLETETNGLSSYRMKQADREVDRLVNEGVKGNKKARAVLEAGGLAIDWDSPNAKEEAREERGWQHGHTVLGNGYGKADVAGGLDFLEKMLRARDRKAEQKRAVAKARARRNKKRVRV